MPAVKRSSKKTGGKTKSRKMSKSSSKLSGGAKRRVSKKTIKRKVSKRRSKKSQRGGNPPPIAAPRPPGLVLSPTKCEYTDASNEWYNFNRIKDICKSSKEKKAQTLNLLAEDRIRASCTEPILQQALAKAAACRKDCEAQQPTK